MAKVSAIDKYLKEQQKKEEQQRKAQLESQNKALQSTSKTTNNQNTGVSDSIKNLLKKQQEASNKNNTSFLTGTQKKQEEIKPVQIQKNVPERSFLTGKQEQEKVVKTSEKKKLTDYASIGEYRKAEQDNYKKNKEIAMQDEALQNILAMDQTKERDAAKDKYMQDTNLSWRLNELRNKSHKTVAEEDELAQLEHKLLELNNLRRANDTLVDDAILDAAGVVSNTYNSAAYNTDLLLQSIFNPQEKLVETRNADLINQINTGRANTTQALNDSYGELAGFLYQTGLSISDNLALRVLNALAPGASLIAMGSNAAASKALDIGTMKEDATAFEQLGRGLSSGGIEFLTEKMSFGALDNLLGGKNSRSVLRGMIDQAIEEGREEGLSYAFNLGADALWGDEVQWNWGEFAQSVLGGAISGGVMGGPSTFIGNQRFNRMARDIKNNANVQQQFKDKANIEDVSMMSDEEFADLLSNSFESIKDDVGEKKFNKMKIDEIMELVPNHMTKGEKKMWQAGNELDFKQAIQMKSQDPLTAITSRDLVKQNVKEVAQQYGLNERTVEVINGVVDSTGVNVVFTTDMKGQEDADGYYQNGTIYINPNGKKPYMQTLKHELTHHIQYNQEFADIKNYLINEYQGTDASAYRDANGNIKHFTFNDLVARTAIRYAEAGQQLSMEDAEFEALADLVSTSSLFADEKGISKLANTHTDATLKEKIADFFGNMAGRFNGNSEYKHELERVRDLYVNSTYKEETADNFDFADFTVKYSLAKDALKNVNDVINKKVSLKKGTILLDNTPEYIVDLGYSNLPIAMYNKHIVSNVLSETEAKEKDLIFKNSHYHGLGTEKFLELLNGLYNPNKVYRWKNNNEFHPWKNEDTFTVITDKKVDDKTVVIGLQMNSKKNLVSVDVHLVTTVHGRTTDPEMVYESYKNEGYVTEVNIKKEPNLPRAYMAAHVGMVPDANISQNNKMSIDSLGNSLSKEQQEYFKNSKVVDKDGNLKVMYRGGNEDINVFDRKKSRASNLYGRGFYFTDSEAHAKQYGEAIEYYLNITNPLWNEKNITREQIVKLLQAIEDDGEDMDLSNYGYGATVESIADSLMEKDDYGKLFDISTTAVGDLVKTTELFNELNGTTYDGFILPTETVVFNSNQIKKVDNTDPTSNPDVRYSIADSNNEALQIQNDLLLKDKLKPNDLKTYVKSVDAMNVSNQDKAERINLLLNNMGSSIFGRSFVNNYLYAYENGYKSAQEYLDEKRRIQEEQSQKNAMQMEENRRRREEEHNRRAALAKESALSPEEHTQNAIKEFGTTNNFRIAGYILTDGQMLKFGEKGIRGTDHRAIASAFNPDELYDRNHGPGTIALTKFLNEGNIRIIPDTNGLDMAMMPSESQMDQIAKYINSVYGQSFMVDFSDANGNVVDSKEYNKADRKILDDINKFYQSNEVKYSIAPNKSLEKRLSGDRLLDAQDLISDLESVNANVDENGFVTVYHRTSKDAANKIYVSGKMIAKEDGLFFSTNDNGENNSGYGDAVVSLKVPVELLVLDDIFDDEASVRIPLGNKRVLDVSDYLSNKVRYSISSKYTNDVKDIMKKYGSLQMRNSQEVEQVLSDIAKEIATTGDFTEDNKNALMKLIRENVMASRDNNNGEIYQEIKKQFGGTKLYVDAKYDNFLKRHNLRNRLRGLFTLTSDKANADYSIDSFYNELVENYNGVFEQLDTEEDQLLELAERLKEIKADNRKMQPIGETNEYFFSEEGIVDDIKKYLNNMKARINQMPDAVKNRVTDVYTLLNAEKFVEKNTRLQNFNKFYFNNINAEAARTLGVYANRSENTQKLFQNAIQEVAEGGDITNKTRDALINDLVSHLDKTNEIKLDEYTEQQMKFFKADTDSTFKSIVKDELNNLIRDVQFAMAYADGDLLDDKAIKQAQTRFEKQLREETRNTKVKMASEIVGRTPQQQLKKMGVFDVLQTKESFNKTNEEFDNGIAKGDDVGQITGLDAATINEIRENGNDNVSLNKTLSQNLDTIAGKNVRLREMLRATIERPLDNAKKRMFDDQKHNLEKLSQAMKKYGIKAGSKESKAVQWYGEGTKDANDPEAAPYTLKDLQQDFPNKWEDIVAFEKFCRQMYDDYFERINQARQSIYPNPLDQAYVDLANAQSRINEYERIIANNKINNIYDDNFISKQYENLERAKNDVERITKAINNGDYTLNKVLPKRKDYFHHFQEISAEHGNVLKIINNPNDYKISNKLSGLSEGTKPKAKFTGFMQHREHGDYEADAVGGLLKYIPVAEYAIHIDPRTAHLRGIIKAMRDTSNADDTDLAYTINYLTHYTNNLAGKTFILDRIVTDVIPGGRKVMQTLKAINSKVKGNAILGNMRSAISQFYNLPIGLSMIKNPVSMAKGAMQYARYLKGDKNAVDIMNQSSFLQERYFDKIYNELDLNDDSQIKKMATWMMQFGDEVVSRNVWFGAYEDAIAQNMNQQEAIGYADNLTRNAVAGRGIGEVPLLQQSEVVKLFAPFQVEVNNQWQYIKQLTNDVVSGGPDEKKKAAWQMFIMFAVTWGMNELREKLLDGNRTGMDIVDAFTDVFNSINEGDVSFTTTAGRLGGEVLSNVPYASQLTPLLLDETQSEALFGDADPTRFGTQNIGVSGLLSPLVQAAQGKNVDIQGLAFDYLTPWGGAQLDRTLGYMQDRGLLPKVNVNTKEGVKLERNEVAGSYSDNGRLRYALDEEDVPETIRGLLFGTTGTQAAREYYDNGAKALSDSKTQAYVEARKAGATYKEMDGVMNDITKFESLKDSDGDSITYSKGKQTADYINGLSMNAKAKETLYKTYALSDSQREVYDRAIAAGGSYNQLKDAMFEIAMIESLKDSSGKSINNSKALQTAKYINELNVSEEVKDVLREEYLSKTVKEMSIGEVYGRLKNLGVGKTSSSSSYRSSRSKKTSVPSVSSRIKTLLSANSSNNNDFNNRLKQIIKEFESKSKVS